MLNFRICQRGLGSVLKELKERVLAKVAKLERYNERITQQKNYAIEELRNRRITQQKQN